MRSALFLQLSTNTSQLVWNKFLFDRRTQKTHRVAQTPHTHEHTHTSKLKRKWSVDEQKRVDNEERPNKNTEEEKTPNNNIPVTMTAP